MTIRGRILLVIAVLAFIIVGPSSPFAWAEGGGEKGSRKIESDSPPPKEPRDSRKQPWDQRPSVTRHSLTIKGKIIEYTATAGYLPLSDESGKVTAHVFFISYVKEPGTGKGARPLTFSFNGGPGAASVWLHMAAMGPRRVILSDEGKGVPPPYGWTTNDDTWLDFTDLVFIDPIGTGYSRPVEDVKAEAFLGVQKDIESVAQFIRLYTTRYERWLSPKFLAGESYGTTRAAGLSKYLQDKVGMALNGIVLISTVLDFQSVSPGPDNDLFYALLLPAYTAASQYHGKLSPALKADPVKTLAEVELFALQEYLPALSMGYALTAAERERIVDKLALYTGLRHLTIRNSNLRIDRRLFAGQLLDEKNLRLGLYDSRFTANYRYEQFMEDPSIFEVTAPMLSACNDYLRGELKWESDLPYEFISDKIYHQWNWGSADSGYVNTTASLAMALNQNRFLKVFMAGGYYDLVTSYFAAKYSFNRMGSDADLRSRITVRYYDGGHQLYMDPLSRRKLTEDGAAFYRKAQRAE